MGADRLTCYGQSIHLPAEVMIAFRCYRVSQQLQAKKKKFIFNLVLNCVHGNLNVCELKRHNRWQWVQWVVKSWESESNENELFCWVLLRGVSGECNFDKMWFNIEGWTYHIEHSKFFCMRPSSSWILGNAIVLEPNKNTHSA